MKDGRSKIKQFIDAAMVMVRDTGDPEKLPVAMRHVVYVDAAQGLIDNGGLQYFFESNFPNCPEYSRFIDAYRAIGATEEAQALEAAVALFPFSEPHKFVQRRNDFL